MWCFGDDFFNANPGEAALEIGHKKRRNAFYGI